MQGLQTMNLIASAPLRGRDRRLLRAIDEGRGARGRGRGRAWINGSEAGGRDPRFAHLTRSYE